jgi:hypothetical protein
LRDSEHAQVTSSPKGRLGHDRTRLDLERTNMDLNVELPFKRANDFSALSIAVG